MLPAYVIHARSLSERSAHIQGELDRAGIAFEWVLDCDANEITPQIDATYFHPSADLTMKQKSCAMKHIVAMERICKANHDFALVFEDDALLVPNFTQRLRDVMEEATRWPRPRILHLGAATNFYTPASQIRPGVGVYVGSRVRNMEAYVLGATEARARLDWIASNPMTEPIDIAFNFGDPAMGILFLWPEPPLAEQGSLTGRFASSLDRKERGQMQLRVQFAIQKFKRRWLYRWLRLK